ncbi:type I-C CRISPR-associated protein Cas7/Csd2 [Fuchsiella alkaliacetigena]|nr:type I-C CRISPR-associated protein Cas7/Csd2 [Fuchsiella alkaliacetigena]
MTDGNPNGDPDAGNLPRIDPETMQGLVSDVCIKRKVRNWVSMTSEQKIYVEEQGILYNKQQKAFEALEIDEDNNDRESIEKARQWMCKNYYDVRMFGAVMSTSKFNSGQVRGPMQVTFSRSVDPVVPMDLSITRVAVTKPEDARQQTSEEEGESSDKVTEMGRKSIIPYGLYIGHGFFNPFFAEDTGVEQKDLELFWEAIEKMWDIDRSASKGFMACRGLYVFSHDKKTGNAPAHKLVDLINVSKKDNVQAPRSFNDYEVEVEESKIPEGVELNILGG